MFSKEGDRIKIIQEKINISLRTLIYNEASIDTELKLLLESFIDYKEPSEYVLGTLCVIHYRDYTVNFNEEIYDIAAAIELLILSLDIIDDIQDSDTDYIWMKSPKFSLNAVLAMVRLSSKIVRKSSFEHQELVLQTIDEYIFKSINGQQLDLSNNCRDESTYIQMITQKSGSLTAMSCLIGIILAQGKVYKDIERYGTALGVIQQIKNDIQDLKECNRKNDALNKKYSLPIIYLLSLQNEISKKLDAYYNGNGSVELLENITEDLKESGSITYALAIKNLHKYSAFEILETSNLSSSSKDFIKTLMK